MGSMKEQMMNEQEESRDELLASLLGITCDELQQTEWSLDEQANNDGIVTNVLVNFSEDSPKEILAKISGLDENNTVWLESNALENAAFFKNNPEGEQLEEEE